MSKKNSGQTSFLVKALFLIVAVIIFVFIIKYFSSFRAETIQQKDESNFKISVLNVLQKLVSDETCLSYKGGNPKKPILSIEKIESFASTYMSTEPECAKAADFDYAIRIMQLPYNFTLDPGQKKIRGELKLGNDFSSHPYQSNLGSDRTVFFDCNFVPEEHPELCQNTELDMIVCADCKENPREKCPYPYNSTSSSPWATPGVCCIYYDCPKDACECTEVKPGVGDCGSGCIVSRGCDVSRCEWINLYPAHGGGWHGACGMTFDYTLVPSGEVIDVRLEKNIWEFGLSFGQLSFSPSKARQWETQLSLPITIKYNESFSTEGVIYIYAVSGELEKIYGSLEDVCEKAKIEGKEMSFVKEFHFSYPVEYDTTDRTLCMGNSCKTFDCPYELDFENIKKEGDYALEFSFDPEEEKITVKK